MAERFARALDVFSRARAAKERRLRREIEPMTEPVKLGVLAAADGETVGGSDVARSEATKDDAEVSVGRPKSIVEEEDGTATTTAEEDWETGG
jgi:hypothetical protein